MRTSKLDDSLPAREGAAERAHDEPFAKTDIDWRTKARIASPLDRCQEAARDLERFLGRAAADASEPALHAWLYDAAKTVGGIPPVIREALVSIDAWARGNAEGPQATATPSPRLEQPYVQNAGNAWFGVAPSVTLKTGT